MKRYSINYEYDNEDYRSSEMIPEANGDWVRFDDIEHLLKDAQKTAHNKEYEITPSASSKCLRHFSYSRNVRRNKIKRSIV